MSEIRILEAITPSRIGGAEVYVADLCQGLAELGAEIELFCPSGRPFVEYAAARGIPSINWKTRGKIDPITVLKLARLIKNDSIDVVHTHLSTASLLGAFAAKLAGKPSVAHVHGLNSATCFKHSSAVIAVSEAVKRHICAQGLPESRVHVVHNGVDLEKFEPMPLIDAKRDFGLEADTKLIGVFGRLSSEKGQKVALEAMAQIVKNLPDAQMLIVGDGKDREELLALAESLGISKNVRFEGFNPNIRPMMAACDIVLVPSLKEGFGLTAVNAMALERPVVATNIGGLPEIVVDGETGLLTPANDPVSMSQRIEELLSDPASMQRMGKLGRRRAEDSFDLTHQIGQALRVLKEQADRA